MKSIISQYFCVVNRKLLKILILGLVAAGCVIIPVTPVFAISNPDSIAINTWEVFENVFEADDMLFVVSYDVDYTIEPTEDASDAFNFQVLDTDGSTLLASRPLSYYQYDLTSIYLDAAQAATLTWESAYSLRILGNPALFGSLVEGTNMVTKVLAPSDWNTTTTLGDTEELLYIHFVAIATALETDRTATFLVDTAGGQVLNTAGRIIFLTAVPAVDSVVPDLFQQAGGFFDTTRDVGTGAYDTYLTYNTQIGTRLAASFDGIGAYFGTSGQTMGALFIVLVALMVAGIVFFYTGNTIAAMVLAVPMMVMGNWLGLVPLAISFIIVMMFVVYMAYHLWLRGV